MSGWIALHRKLTEWEWYTEPNTLRVFLHCLLMANYKDARYRGRIVKRGQFLTGTEVLAKELKLSRQKIRTALTNLKLTNEITIESTSRGSCITVCKYDTYQQTNFQTNQQDNQPINQQITNSQPTDNQQITTNNNDNNINNGTTNEQDLMHWLQDSEEAPPIKVVKQANHARSALDLKVMYPRIASRPESMREWDLIIERHGADDVWKCVELNYPDLEPGHLLWPDAVNKAIIDHYAAIQEQQDRDLI